MGVPILSGLFGGPSLRDEMQSRVTEALRSVQGADGDLLLQLDTEVLISEVLSEFRPVILHWDQPTMTEPTQYNQPVVRDVFGQLVHRSNAHSTITIPLDGEALLLTYRSDNGAPLSPLPGQVKSGCVEFEWSGALTATADDIRRWLQHKRTDVERFLVYNNADVPQLNERMRSQVRTQVERRKSDELQRRQLAAGLPFPIARAAGTQAPLKVQRKTVSLVNRDRTQSTYAPEPVLETADYQSILGDCVALSTVLERMPGATTLGEEGLRNLLLATLNTNYRGQVAGELFNGSGKTDICVRVSDRNVFIGECKFYDGPVSVQRAIDQLLSYLVWRDTKAALLLFVRGGNFSEVVQKAVSAMSDHAQCQRVLPHDDPSSRSEYLFTREDDPTRTIHLALLPFKIPE